eukprot:3709427-Pyramimonas_sp.AAC.1
MRANGVALGQNGRRPRCPRGHDHAHREFEVRDVAVSTARLRAVDLDGGGRLLGGGPATRISAFRLDAHLAPRHGRFAQQVADLDLVLAP